MIKMITSLHEDDLSLYKKFLEPSAKRFKSYLFQAVTKKGTTDEGIARKYNLGIEVMIQNSMLNENDTLIFINEDIGIVDGLFPDKLETVFNEKSNIGMVGVLGSSQISNSVEWWMNPPDKLRGHIIQGTESPEKGKHLEKGPIGFYDDVVALDKCFMAVRANLVKEEELRFDDSIFKGEDLYNIDFCVQVLKKGYKIAVIDLLLHQARTPVNNATKPEWNKERETAINKWKDDGLELPITINNFELEAHSRPEVLEVEV